MQSTLFRRKNPAKCFTQMLSREGALPKCHIDLLAEDPLAKLLHNAKRLAFVLGIVAVVFDLESKVCSHRPPLSRRK